VTKTILLTAAALVLSTIAVTHAAGPYDGYYELRGGSSTLYLSIIQDGSTLGLLRIPLNAPVGAGLVDPIEGVPGQYGGLVFATDRVTFKVVLTFTQDGRCTIKFDNTSLECVRIWGATPAP
jgi:hypothetical protein